MEILPIVLVKGQDGNPLRINKADYDENPSDWELVDDEVVAPAAVVQTPAAQTTIPTGLVVNKIGTKDAARFFVTDASKNKVVFDGIDSENGYATDGEAWAAIMALSTGAQG